MGMAALTAIHTVEVRLRPRSRSLLFLLGIGSVSLLLAMETVLVGIASFSEPPVGARWLLALNPNDPQSQFQLGRVYEKSNPTRSLEYMRRATELSPYSRFYWWRLSNACASAGNNDCAERARQRLLQLCPMVPLYHWYDAQRDLRMGREDDAMAQFRHLLELDPSYAISTWDSLRAVQSPDVLYQKMFTDRRDPELEISYVNFLSGRGEDDAAFSAWKQTAANSGSFTLSTVRPYLERLIWDGRMDEAAQVWKDLQRQEVVRRPVSDDRENLVFNGGFEAFPLNNGFDWRWGRLTYTAIDFSAPDAYRGAHCLRLDFTVSRNQEYEPVYQVVPVSPNHRYRLEAYVRSEDITSDTGPVLRASDTGGAGFADAVSETTVGTTPWHPVRVDFATGPKTQAVRLSVWRPRGRTFPTEISGTFWLDEVSLKCLDCDSTAGTEQSQANNAVQ